MKRILIFGFPFLLLFLEGLMRNLLSIDTLAFTGPAIGAAGISFLLPLIVPIERGLQISQRTLNSVTNKRGVVIHRAEMFLIGCAWLLIMAATIAWAFSLYYSCEAPMTARWNVPVHLWIGGVTYTLSVAFAIGRGSV